MRRGDPDIEPTLPENVERQRLARLRALDLLDTPAEAPFDAAARSAAAFCATPMAAVTLIDETRQWFKASTGLGALCQTSRDIAFCAYTIQNPGLFEVEDAALDPRFSQNPLVIGAPGIRFYAGAPLVLPGGERIGALVVMDTVPRILSDNQRAALRELASVVSGLVVLRDISESGAQAARLASIVELSDDAIVGKSLDSIITSWNRGAEQLFGYLPEETIGHHISMLFPQGHDEETELLATLHESGQVRNFETVRRHKNGSDVDVSVSMSPIRDHSGRTVGVAKIARDISVQKDSARALARSEARYRAIVEDQVDLVSLATPNGTLTFVNEAYARHFGCKPATMVGTRLYDYVPPEERDTVVRHLRTVCETKQVIEAENRMLSAAGEPRWVAWTNRVVVDAAGNVSAIHSVGRDVTARKIMEAELRRAQADLQAIMDHSPVMISSWNRDFTNRFANRSYAAWYGTTPGAMAGRDLCELIGEEAYQKSRPFLERVLEGEAQSFERATSGPDGVMRHTQVDYLPALGTEGEHGPFVFVTDITRRVAAEQAVAVSAERFQSLYERTPAMMHSIDHTGAILSVSATWLEKLGYSRSEVTGRKSTEFLTDASAHYAKTVILPAFFMTGRVKDAEYQMVCKDGRIIDVLLSALAETDETGAFVRTLAVIEDVTARKKAEKSLQQSEASLDRAGRIARVGAWAFDARTQEIHWSDETCRIHEMDPGYRPSLEEVICFYSPEARGAIEHAVVQCLQDGTPFDLEVPFITQSGRRMWARSAGEADVQDGVIVRLFGSFQDVTERKTFEIRLAEQHEMLRVTLKSIGDAVITTDATGNVTWLNPVAERMTGWMTEEATGRPLPQIFHIVNEDSRLPTENPVAMCLRLGRIVGLANHTILISRTEEEFGIEDSAAPIRNATGEVLGVVLVFHDVTEQRRMSGEMTYRASHDALTGLVNRSAFEGRLQIALDRARDEDSEHALLYIDLDQFKLVNDACGHSAGDQLLQSVAKLLANTVRARDTLARLGGDEFAVILEHCTSAQARRVADQICEKMEEYRFVHDGRRFRVGASIGLVPIDGRWRNLEAIVQAADTACYAAKEAGRNRVHVWFDTDAAIHARHGEMQWATRLEQALDENRFVLFAQRIYSLATDDDKLQIEVLLRLRESDETLILPGAFLPAAERFNLSTRIDRWVLRTTVDLLLAQPDLSRIDAVNINLSGKSVGDRAFHRQAIAILEASGPAVCQCIGIEITETAAITNMADAVAFIEQLQNLGVRVSLDDFGAGASSFGYLKSLSVDLLKIDGQFVRDIIDDPLDDAAVRCFQDVARVVGMKTVAEFVDDYRILERLHAIGIDYVQGFLLHKPEPIECVLDNIDADQDCIRNFRRSVAVAQIVSERPSVRQSVCRQLSRKSLM